MKKALMILTVAALSMLGSAVYADTAVLPVEPEVAAVVTVDAGTVFEVSLDAENQVIGVETLNETGTAVLEGVDLTGQPVEDAVGELITAAAEEGTLPADGSVSVDVVIIAEEVVDPVVTDPVATDPVVTDPVVTDPAVIEDTLEDIITDEIIEVTDELDIPVVITYPNAALERVALAQTLGITPGKLNLIQKYAASTGTPETVVVADWTGASVKDIMAAIKTNRKAAALPEITPDPEAPVVTEPVDTVVTEPVAAAATVTAEKKSAPEKTSSPGKSGGKGGSKGGKKK